MLISRTVIQLLCLFDLLTFVCKNMLFVSLMYIILKYILSDATLASVSYLCYCIYGISFPILFTFNLFCPLSNFMSIYLKWIPCEQHIVESSLFILSDIMSSLLFSVPLCFPRIVHTNSFSSFISLLCNIPLAGLF